LFIGLRSSRVLIFLKGRREKIAVIFLFILAFLIRLLYLSSLNPNDPIHLEGDAVEYDEIAKGILTGEGFVTVHRPPLYPLFLALLYYLYNYSFFAVWLFQSLLSSLTCVILFLLGKRVFNSFVGIIAGAIAAFYAPLIFYSGMLYSETLFFFLFSLLLLAIANFLPNLKNMILVGLLFALSALTRPEVLLFLPFWWISALLERKRLRKEVINSLAIATGATFLFIAPWTVRNYLVYKDFVFISTRFGENLYVGSDLNHYGLESTVSNNLIKGMTSPIEIDRKLFHLALKNYREHPREILLMDLAKMKKVLTEWSAYDHWQLDQKYSFYKGIQIPTITSFTLIALLGLGGILVSLPQNRFSLFSLLLLLGNFFTQIIFFPSPRYRLQVEPILALFAGYTLFALGSIFYPLFQKFSLLPSRLFLRYWWVFLAVLIIFFSSFYVKVILPALTPKRYVIVEGEKPVQANMQFDSILNSNFLSGKSLEFHSTEVPPGGFQLKYSFFLKEDGEYRIWMAGTPPGPDSAGNPWFSPFWLGFDSENLTHFTEEQIPNGFPYSKGGYHWTLLASKFFSSGTHTICLKLDEPRLKDNSYVLYLDGFLLTPKDWVPARKIGKIPMSIFIGEGK